ncbi:hypothetical protein ACYOEI_05390, partial [Singulisphaera rosea]
VPAALQHAGTLAGFAATLASVGQALDKPYSTHAIIAGGICGLIATVIKSPQDPPKDPEA